MNFLRNESRLQGYLSLKLNSIYQLGGYYSKYLEYIFK